MVVDRAIAAALRQKRPVYIEIASDLWREPLALPTGRPLGRAAAAEHRRAHRGPAGGRGDP